MKLKLFDHGTWNPGLQTFQPRRVYGCGLEVILYICR